MDKSAAARMKHPAVRVVLEPLLTAGLVARCSVFELEMLFSARDPRELAGLAENLRGLPLAETEQRDFDRAIDIMGALSRARLHRAVKLPDLILAAVAERHGLTVLHYDSDFDLIAQHSNLVGRWVVPRGSV